MGREKGRERFKESAHAVWGLASPNLQGRPADLRPKGPLMLQLGSKDKLETEPLLPWGTSVCVLLRVSTHWMNPTHIVEGNLLYSESTDLNTNLI